MFALCVACLKNVIKAVDILQYRNFIDLIFIYYQEALKI